MSRQYRFRILFFIVGLVTAFVVFSLNSHDEKEVTLRDAMQHRLQDMIRMKKAFEDGSIPTPDPNLITFAGLDHSEAVDEVDSYQDHFLSFDEYYADLKGYSIQQRQDAINHYNSIVRSCESCHQTVCPGPLRSIKRLTVKDIRPTMN